MKTEFDTIVREIQVWLLAPPLIEAQRRVGLLRRLLAENPE